MPAGLDFASLFIIAILAFLVPLVLARVKAVPIVVGEILIGILVGRSGLGWVAYDEPAVLVLSEIGFAFLMFLSGLEIDFSLLSNSGARRQNGGSHPIWLAAANFLATVLLAIPAGLALTHYGLAGDPWMMALILSTTSLGIVVPVLKERSLSAGFFGQTIVLAALLADFITMLLITVYVTLFSSGLTIEILLMGLLFLAFLVTYRLGLAQLRRPTVRRLIDSLEAATSQFKVRGSIAFMLAFVVLAELVDVELILGAFLAGAQLSLLNMRDEEGLREKLDAIGFGFFIPVFFIGIGLQFNLPLLLDNPSALLLAPLLLVISVVIKLLAGLVFRRAFSWRDTLAAGWLLSARLSLIIAAAAVGLRIGAISEATNAAIIFVAALTSTLAPLAANALLPPREEGRPRRFLIYGAANLGLQVAQELRRHGESILFLEPEAKLADLVRKEGFEVLQGHGTRECLRLAAVKEAETLLVLSGDDQANYAVCQTALDMGANSIVANVNEPARLPEFRELGVRAITPTMLRPLMLAGLARNPDMFTLLTSTTDERDIREVWLRNPVFVGRKVSSIVFPGDSLVLTIHRGDEIRVPHGSTRLQLGDRLTILGDLDSLNAVQRLLER